MKFLGKFSGYLVIFLLCSSYILPRTAFSYGYVVLRDKDREHEEPRYLAIAARIDLAGVLYDERQIDEKGTRIYIETESNEKVIIQVHQFVALGERNDYADKIIERLRDGENILVEQCGRASKKQYESIAYVMESYETEFVCERAEDFQLGYEMPTDSFPQFVVRRVVGRPMVTEMSYSSGRLCLEASTLVATPNGDVSLDSLKKGVHIYSYDRNAGQVVIDEVHSDVRCYETSDFIELQFRGEDEDENKILYTTRDHPFYVDWKYGTDGYKEPWYRYVPAGSLTLGSRFIQLHDSATELPILTLSEQGPILVSSALLSGKNGKDPLKKRLCNFAVKKFGSYFANSILVHNKVH